MKVACVEGEDWRRAGEKGGDGFAHGACAANAGVRQLRQVVVLWCHSGVAYGSVGHVQIIRSDGLEQASIVSD